MDIKNRVSGIILAGGQNRRMGQNKALVEWRGKRLLNWVYDAIKPLCSEIIISSNEESSLFPDALIVPDNYSNIGPVAGIEAGLSGSSSDINIIVSCDTPLLTTDFFRYMISKHGKFDISIPVHNGINEPMIGIYSRSVLPVFQQAISEGLFKPPHIIKSCIFQEIEINRNMNFYAPDMFLNMNSPEDLKKL